ncbi:MAG: hypothetical protein N838_30290 [Thiohalocapsa sp. PB-PSB1]|jgi:hypothetical protein|nr:MAG: hypothetical protein N838_30290 [Thiohalocapsa sp. PB-PSB1]
MGELPLGEGERESGASWSVSLRQSPLCRTRCLKGFCRLHNMPLPDLQYFEAAPSAYLRAFSGEKIAPVNTEKSREQVVLSIRPGQLLDFDLKL